MTRLKTFLKEYKYYDIDIHIKDIDEKEYTKIDTILRDILPVEQRDIYDSLIKELKEHNKNISKISKGVFRKIPYILFYKPMNQKIPFYDAEIF